MSSCLRQSFSLPRKIFISNKNSSVKFYSALSSKQNGCNNYYNRSFVFLNKINTPRQSYNRCFSLGSFNSFFESIRSSEVSQLLTNFLIKSHDLTGLSWTVTIIAATIIVKLFVGLPCGIYQQYLTAKIELTKVELNKLSQSIKDEVLKRGIKGRWTQEKLNIEFRKEMRKLWSALIVKNNCHPFKITVLFFAQFPLWLLLTLTIRTIAMDSNAIKQESPVSALQFLVGGPFWCRNLSVPDPTYILPTINSLSMLLISEITVSSKIKEKISQGFRSFLVYKLIPNVLRLLAVVFFFISAASPAGVSLFWTSSSLFALCQNLLYLSPRVRRFLKIPKTASEIEKPYRHLYDDFIRRFTKVFMRRK